MPASPTHYLNIERPPVTVKVAAPRPVAQAGRDTPGWAGLGDPGAAPADVAIGSLAPHLCAIEPRRHGLPEGADAAPDRGAGA